MMICDWLTFLGHPVKYYNTSIPVAIKPLKIHGFFGKIYD